MTKDSIDRFWTWFDAKVNDAMQTDDGKAFANAGLEVAHTGGGNIAWEFRHGETYVWITDDDGTGLYTTPETEYWTIGRYDSEGESLEWLDVKTVHEAIIVAKAYQAKNQKEFAA